MEVKVVETFKLFAEVVFPGLQYNRSFRICFVPGSAGIILYLLSELIPDAN